MCSNHKNVEMGFTYEKFPEGTHMCLIYSSENERSKIISKFLKSGLESGEKVAYFADKKSPSEIMAWLQEKGIEISKSEQKNQLSIHSTAETYYPNGEFIPENTLETLKTFYTNSKNNNFESARVTGEMSWALKGIKGSERLMEYESKANEVFIDYPITAICQYDANQFDGATILECLKVHPYMIVYGQIVENPFYLRNEDYLKTLNL